MGLNRNGVDVANGPLSDIVPVLRAFAAVGGIAVHALHAQAKPPIYMVAVNDVSNVDGYLKEYVPPATKSVKSHGGAYVAQGFITTIDGSLPGERMIVVRWDDIEQLRAWRTSSEYTAARTAGDKYAKLNIVAVDAVKQ